MVLQPIQPQGSARWKIGYAHEIFGFLDSSFLSLFTEVVWWRQEGTVCNAGSKPTLPASMGNAIRDLHLPHGPNQGVEEDRDRDVQLQRVKRPSFISIFISRALGVNLLGREGVFQPLEITLEEESSVY